MSLSIAMKKKTVSYRDNAKPGPVQTDEEDKDLFPVSPWYGPDTKCCKCGSSNSYYIRDSTYGERPAFHKGDLATRRITKAKFCAPGQRIRLRIFPWPKRCKHPGNHLHQKCKACGAEFVSYPKCQDPKND